MITSLLIRNFKSIEDSGKLELKPLTMFTGPNSSGKSNILKSLAVLAQTVRLPVGIERSFDKSLLNGEFVRYPHPPTDYVIYKRDLDRSISFEVRMKPNDLTESALVILLKRAGLSKYVSISSIGYKYSYRPITKEASNCIFIEDDKIIEVASVKTEAGQEERVTYPDSLAKFRPYEAGSTSFVLSKACFHFLHPRGVTDTESLFAEALSRVADEVVTNLADNLSRAYFIEALRGGVELPVKAGATPSWVGKNGEYLVEILALCFSRREYSAKADRINEWAQKFWIGNMKAGWWGKDELGSDFEDPKLRSVLNLALASFGSKQVLSIITQLFWSEPGDLIMVEEPEISLHPESQVLLQDLFATAIADGKQVICSTHSPFLILALSKVIKDGKLSRDNVAVYHVEKGENGTKAKRLELDKHGFVTGWIPSYLKVEHELFDEWAESLEKE